MNSNAAKNVLSRAKLPEGIGDVKPAETEPTPTRKGRRAWSKKQEPPRAVVTPFEGPSGPSMEMR
jgi:hypothetical protein